mgnify:CR=1 FL=1
MTIIKRRKTTNYLQVHNHPVQKDLEDLAAIGLLTYIMSLPEDWTIHKTQLQAQFTRRKTDGAWKILAQKGYAIGFSCYIKGRVKFFYTVSDIAFTQEEYLEFVESELKGLLNDPKIWDKKSIIPISNVKPMQDISCMGFTLLIGIMLFLSQIFGSLSKPFNSLSTNSRYSS